MDSKECLNNLISVAGCERCGCSVECEEQIGKYGCVMCEQWHQFIKQDLDKLEQLEKKYQELEERYKHRAKLQAELCDGLNQYEKVLSFLVNKFKLKLKGNRLYFLFNNQYFELGKEEEKLMKESFRYE